jgi:hypothetical protein
MSLRLLIVLSHRIGDNLRAWAGSALRAARRPAGNFAEFR